MGRVGLSVATFHAVLMPLRTLRSHPFYRLPGTVFVLVGCTLAVLATAAVLGVFAWRDRDAAIDRATSTAANLSLLVAEHAARVIETGDLQLHQAVELAGPPDAAIPSDYAAWERLAALADAAPHVQSLWLGDADGNAVLMSRTYPAPPLNAGDREYFQALRDGTTMYVGRIEESRDGSGPLLVLSRPLAAPMGVFRGFATVAVSPRTFADIYGHLDVGYRATISLQRQDGSVLVREGAAAQPPEGEVISIRRQLDGYPLVADITIPMDSVLTYWRERVAGYVVYGLGALLVVAAIGMLANQRVRRIRMAEDALQHAYDTLEERVGQRTAELEQTNHRLEGALADKGILLKEVQHRVKNNLQVICSLLRLQAARLDERSRFAFDESLRRIQSMSLVHELLYRSEEPARINFAEYLRQLCDSLGRAGGPSVVRVTVEAEDWTLDVDRAMPLALIASELVSNALRHAFSDGHAGSVLVRLAPGPDGMRMEVRDDGIGLPADLPPAPADKRRGGLGLVLVQSLARQAHADLHVVRGFEGGRGTAFTVAIPDAARRSKAA